MCNTVGCSAPGRVHPQQVFCQRCGWPLARASLEIEPQEVVVVPHASIQAVLRVDNRGSGPLRWRFGKLPPGVSPANAPREVDPGQNQSITLHMDPGQLPGDEQAVQLPIETFDRAGVGPEDFRSPKVDHCWQRQTLSMPMRRPHVGPLQVPWRNVLFGHDVKSVTIHGTNLGEVDLDIRVAAENGYRVKALGREESAQIPLAFEPREKKCVTIVPPDQAVGQSGHVRFLALPDAVHEWVSVGVHWVEAAARVDPDKRYVVAVDLGTSKTAAAVLDQHVAGATPDVITWAKPDGAEAPFIPSAVELGEKGEPIAFGYNVPETSTEGDAPNIETGLKMRMVDADKRLQRSIVFLLRAAFDQIANRYDWDIFDNSILVFTVPALDMGEEYGRHVAVYRELIGRAGQAYGIDPDAVHFYPEPECAAVEHLCHLQEQVSEGDRNYGLPQDEWICVLDIGAGTTDIAFAWVDFDEDGAVVFNRIASLGYGIAGDEVDKRLLDWCLEQWRQRGLLEATPTEEAPRVGVAGEDLSRQALVREIRAHKEALYGSGMAEQPDGAQPDRAVLDMFLRNESHLELTREDVSQRVRPMAQALFQYGGRHIGKQLQRPPVKTWLLNEGAKLRLVPARVAAIFRSGGTAHIPDFGDALKEMVLPRSQLCDLENPRLHVVRGAARRPSIRAQHRLLGDLWVQWSNVPERQVLLARGAVPQRSDEVSSGSVRRSQSVAMSLHIDVDGQDIELYRLASANASHESRKLGLVVEYATKGNLMLNLAWLAQPREEIVSRELVQRLPTR